MRNSMYYTTSGLTSLPEYQGGGYLDQYGRQKYGLGKFVSKITRPIAKVLDKIVPNEIKPALPFVAAAVPFMLGPTFSFGGLSPALSRAIAAAGANAVSQLSQEGAAERGINPVSLALSGAGGYLSTPGVGDSLRAGTILGTDPTTGAIITKGSELAGQIQTTSPTFLQSAENVARGITSYGADTLSKGTESFQNIIGGTSTDIGKDLLTAGKAYVPGALQASGELAYNAALDAQKKYEQEMAAMGALSSANKQQQIDYIRRAMQSAGFTEDEIGSALTRSGFASGGITRTKFGGGGPGMGSPRSYESFKDFLEQINISYPELDIINIYDNNPSDAIKILEGMGLISQGKKDMGPTYAAASPVNAAEGGLMNLRMGGMPVEMDFRAKGGFVPIGKKERADDVPARLSKNEFVFTAKAVRNAGGGDIRKGAKRMYQIMNQLEARA